MKPILDLSETDINDVKMEVKYCVEKDVHNLHILKSVAAGYPPIPVAEPNDIKSSPSRSSVPVPACQRHGSK